MGYDQLGISFVHGQRTRDDEFLSQVPRLPKYVVDSRPVYGNQQHVRFPSRLGGLARASVAASLARELVQLLLTSRIAEYDAMSGARKDGSELRPHQSRTEYANSHVRNPRLFCDRCW